MFFRPNETLELIHGALEGICDVACTQVGEIQSCYLIN